MIHKITHNLVLFLGIVFTVYLVTKVLVQMWMEKKNEPKQGGHSQLDNLIKQKEIQMGRMQRSKSPAKAAANNQNLLELYQTKKSLFEEQGNEAACLTLNFLIKLENDIQWGEGGTLKALSAEIANEHTVFISQNSLKKSYQFLASNNLLFPNKKNDHPFNLPLLQDLLIHIAFFMEIGMKIEKKDLPGLRALTKTKSSPLPILAIFLSPDRKSPLSKLKEVANLQAKSLSPKIENYINQIPLEIHDSSYQASPLENLISEFKNISASINLFMPLEFGLGDLKGKSREELLGILGLKKTIDEDKIKQEYRTFVKERHPDKICQNIQDQDLITLANENFSIIKEVYKKLGA